MQKKVYRVCSMEAKYGKSKRKGEREQEHSLLNDKRKAVQKEINARKIWTEMVTERGWEE